MNIHMIGIDHTNAPLDIRAQFAFTKTQTLTATAALLQQEGVQGAVILSTCNRTEVWVSTTPAYHTSLVEEICARKHCAVADYASYFVARDNEQAVSHLFYLACGLKSQIMGEDQILSQVKESIAFARAHGTCDSVLEVLFRIAITAAKQVKTQVVFPKTNASTIACALHRLAQLDYTVTGKTCLVIGNGQMGQLAARAFVEKGAQVFVTVRQYHHSQVTIPDGCTGIDYEQRFAYLAQCDVVVSATASPHYTLTAEKLAAVPHHRPWLLLDLAVPRDIAPDAAQLPLVTLYDMDDFHAAAQSEALRAAHAHATQILEEKIKEFYDWTAGKDLLPRIDAVKDAVTTDVLLRLQKPLKPLPLTVTDQALLHSAIAQSTQKVSNKLLFALRSALDGDQFTACLTALENLYEE